MAQGKKYNDDVKEKDEGQPKRNAALLRLPFGLCKQYGIKTEDSWTPRDAWNALKGRRGIDPREAMDDYLDDRDADKPAVDAKEQKETVEAFMNCDRIRVTTKNREALQKCFEAGTKEMQEVTSRLFIEDSFSYLSGGAGEFAEKGNAVHMDYADELYGVGSTFYHESWHAIDYNYGEISEADIKRELTEKNNALIKLYLERRIHPTFYNRQLKENIQEVRGKAYMSCSHRLSTGKTFKDTLLEETKGRGRGLLNSVGIRYEKDKKELGQQVAIRKWSDMSDIINGLTHKIICGYHSRGYWDKAGNSRAIEAFAEIASSKAANQESYDIIKSYLPKTVEAFEELYEKIKRGEIPRRQT